ncbi:hypothetical protein DFJ58DRAFT_844681 [Suillus subalutaceus]|uniref:uncharacterized protein n=1 Tax=Suillus subalutaceus TaxID=48586 RepID=UPI001B88337C|nr:uncharacterized protein DFJ58DRAFT_844681 [Suillus subalutaceus]KAG1842366.1 hypothetical protein DFJ58DRAFT_844681 [Suillus subalutaceus]
MAISEKDIPHIHQIVDVALCHGSSMQEVVNKLEDALECAYTPQGYGTDDLDIATLVFRLGGHQLLFALNQSLGLPSLQFQSLHGASLMIDKIALEETAVHFSKYNKSPSFSTYGAAVDIAQKIHGGELHLGKELTVIGASYFGEDEIYPILAAPTCKNEDASDMERILTHAIDRWDRTGASMSIGPIWLLATDGDATRVTFIWYTKQHAGDLIYTLSNMPGLNLYTGKDEVTLDFDFKHIFKRTFFFLDQH